MRLLQLPLLGGLLAAGPAPTTVTHADAGTATVEAVDQQARQVLLRGENGGLHTFHVGPEIRNLGQLRPNDPASVEFREAAFPSPGLMRINEVAG